MEPLNTRSQSRFRPVAHGAKVLHISGMMLVAVLASALAADAAWARSKGRSAGGARSAHHAGTHHYHARSRVGLGAYVAAPVLPWWDYSARAYAVAPVYYIEQSEQAEGEWLYCSAANAYFPYVSECGGGWQRVAAQPQPAQP